MSELMIKYPKIVSINKESEIEELWKNPDHLIVVEEKLDGSNFRFMIYNEQLYFGSRNLVLEEDNEQFIQCIRFIQERVADRIKEGLDLKNYNKVMFFGEYCSQRNRHTMSYDWKQIPLFNGFDAYDLENGFWYFATDSEQMFADLGLAFVPIIEMGKVSELGIRTMTDDNVPLSLYNPGQKAEGLVFKNYTTGVFAKLVTKTFKEENQATFGGDVAPENDSERLVNKYCTNARIDKAIFTLIDQGTELDMPMMKHLPNMVFKDIFEEELMEIARQDWSLKLRDVRKQITHRCKAVLMQMIETRRITGA